MSRSFSKKPRNQAKKNPKPIILLIAEGHNVTESQYFKSFQSQYANYNIKFLIPGSTTDPEGMLRIIERYWNEYDLSPERGDIGFVILDLDCDNSKADLIHSLAARSDNVRFVVSNPCFEVWFMLHFKYSTRAMTSKEAVKEVKTFIPEYEKTLDVFPLLKDKLDTAIENVDRLKKYYRDIGAVWPSDECNPLTDVPIVIEAINERKGK